MTIDPLGKAKRVKRVHKGHAPVFIGGRVCTVHCECGWGSGQYLNPLPDLPRMVWPDEHPATEEDMSIIPPKIDTSTGHDDHVDMTPEDVPAGEAWIVTYLGDECVGVRNGTNIGSSGTIWSLASMEDTRTRWGHDSEITLVSRLVPEVKP